jgi:hypothetical protein
MVQFQGSRSAAVQEAAVVREGEVLDAAREALIGDGERWVSTLGSLIYVRTLSDLSPQSPDFTDDVL